MAINCTAVSLCSINKECDVTLDKRVRCSDLDVDGEERIMR